MQSQRVSRGSPLTSDRPKTDAQAGALLCAGRSTQRRQSRALSCDPAHQPCTPSADGRVARGNMQQCSAGLQTYCKSG